MCCAKCSGKQKRENRKPNIQSKYNPGSYNNGSDINTLGKKSCN